MWVVVYPLCAVLSNTIVETGSQHNTCAHAHTHTHTQTHVPITEVCHVCAVTTAPRIEHIPRLLSILWTHPLPHKQAHMLTYTHVHTRTLMHVYVYTHSCICVHTPTVHIEAYTCTRMHSHHTQHTQHTHTHTHTHYFISQCTCTEACQFYSPLIGHIQRPASILWARRPTTLPHRTGIAGTR